ncbi:MAG: ABC transporter substrate-binding protein [Desulfobacterales bacterium]|nr:MAG: ABC transporter substrate-binding protein [Desulfobacterales bacterium]
MKNILRSFLACFCVLGIASPAMSVTKLDLATTYSGANLHAETCRELAKRIKDATNGDVIITVHEGGSLGMKDEDHFTSVADGIVPMASILMGAAIGTSPLYGLSTSPFLVKNFKESKLLNDIARPYYDKEAEKLNQIILYTAPWPSSSIHAKRPIKTYEDIKGLRIRTYDKNGTDVLKKGGANAVVMSWGDVYPALATGAIDSVLTSSTSAVAGKFWEVLTDTTRVNFAIPLNMININRDTFNSLTKEQQEIFLKVGRDMEERQWKIAAEAMDAEEAILKKNGMNIHPHISDELAGKLRESGRYIIDEWLKKTGKDGKAILDEFEARR